MSNEPKEKSAMVRWDEKLAELAKKSAAIEANVGEGRPMISVKSGILSYKKTPIPGNTMNVIILTHVLHNAKYDGKYDPNNTTIPSCFAFGDTEADMKPHEKAAKPQADACKGCPHNEFGSADTGRGKACKNLRRLAIITELDLDNIKAAEVAFLHIPPTSLKGWAVYVKQLEALAKRPTLGVITTISVAPHATDQFHVEFRNAGLVEDQYIGDLIDRSELVKREIRFPYVQIDKPVAPPVNKFAGKNKFQGRK